MDRKIIYQKVETMSEQGILTEAQESAIGKKIDLLLDFTKIKGLGVLEVVDGLFFTQALRFVDNKWGATLPEQYKETAGKLVIDLVAEEWKAVAEDAADLLDIIIDVPFLEDEAESMFIHGIATMALELISGLAAKKAVA